MSSSREASFLRLVRGETRGPIATAGRLGLSALAAAYHVGTSARNLGYDRGWKTIRRAGVPVVSVGNLTLGGTGKTPMVEFVARWYRRRGLRVAILSRGYGRTSSVNDEAMVLEENLPDVPHLQDSDRLKIAGVAVEELESQLLVLDDGFQHRRLYRDLDIVLLDALDPFGLGRIFPRGLLRESSRSLRRAGVVVLSRADLVDRPTALAIRAKAERLAGAVPWVEARHSPIGLTGMTEGETSSLDGLSDKKVAAFCGIGNPEGFRCTLEALLDEPFAFRTFPDHHPYQATDVAELGRWAVASGADLLLTTQKDFVKLRAETLGGVPLLALKIGLEVLEGADTLEKALQAQIPT